MRTLACYIIVCVQILIGGNAVCSEETETSPGENTFFAVPFALYTSDTGIGFGLAGILSYHRHLPRVSAVRFNTIYTLKKQIITEVSLEHYLRGGSDRLLTSMEYRKFPTDFFGIGNNTNNSDPERYTPENYKFQLYYERQIYYDLKIRPSLYIYHNAVIDRESDGVFSQNSIPWARGRFDAGPGIGFVWDNRDNTQATVSGRFIALDCYRFMFQDKGNGFTLVTLDMRSFFNPAGDLVLGTMINLKDTEGDVPFYLFPQLGGSEYLRGYENDRFMDRSLFLVQQDVRFPLWWRFGGIVFIAAGQVAPRLSDVFSGTYRIAYGIGGRFYINREDHLQVRADLAFSEDSDGFYISYGEAF